jgi:hypothetical protein
VTSLPVAELNTGLPLQPVDMVSPSMVTVPVFAKALPQVIVTAVPSVMLAWARIFPANVELDRRLAEVPSTQNTPSFVPGFIS